MVAKALLAVGLVVVLLLAVGGVLYATDYGVEATVTDKGQDAQGYYIVASTKLLGVQIKHALPFQQWVAVDKGNYVVYHIASGRLQLYDREGGSLIYAG